MSTITFTPEQEALALADLGLSFSLTLTVAQDGTGTVHPSRFLQPPQVKPGEGDLLVVARFNPAMASERVPYFGSLTVRYERDGRGIGGTECLPVVPTFDSVAAFSGEEIEDRQERQHRAILAHVLAAASAMRSAAAPQSDDG